MKLKNWPNGEAYISHCAWKLAEDCEDKDTTRERIEKAAIAFNVTKVSSGVCDKCAKLLQNADDLEGL
jgi:hypothetical protein